MEKIITSTGLELAPCSFCNRKPGYFYNNLNYCWKHYAQKNQQKNYLKNNEIKCMDGYSYYDYLHRISVSKEGGSDEEECGSGGKNIGKKQVTE